MDVITRKKGSTEDVRRKVMRDNAGRMSSVLVNTKPGKVSFDQFVKSNHDVIAEAIGPLFVGFPSALNNHDYRFDKSDFLCWTLDQVIPELHYHSAIGYDMFYENRDRISIKIKGEIFERSLKRSKFGGLTKPKEIVLRNKLGGSEHKIKQEDYFDYLLAIEPRFVDSRRLHLSMAVAPFDMVARRITYNGGKNDQVKCKLNHGDWATLTKTHFFAFDNNQEFEDKKNQIYFDHKRKLARELYELGKNSIIKR